MAGGTSICRRRHSFSGGSKFTLWRLQFLTSTTRYSRVIRIIAGGIPVRDRLGQRRRLSAQDDQFYADYQAGSLNMTAYLDFVLGPWPVNPELMFRCCNESSFRSA